MIIRIMIVEIIITLIIMPRMILIIRCYNSGEAIFC